MYKAALLGAGLWRNDGEPINDPGQRRESCSNDPGNNGIEARDPEGRIEKCESEKIKNQADGPKCQGKGNQHGMERVRLYVDARAHEFLLISRITEMCLTVAWAPENCLLPVASSLLSNAANAALQNHRRPEF